MNSLKQYTISLLILITLLQIKGFVVYCQEIEEDTSSSETDLQFLAERMFIVPKYVINKGLLEFSIGYSNLSFAKPSFVTEMAPAYSWNVEYGFARLTPEKKIPDIYYFAGEFIYSRNVSSHMKPRSWIPDGVTTDTWRFGLGFRTGWGWQFGGNSNFTLYHASSLDWNKTTFEMRFPDTVERLIAKPFDKEMRFGNSFRAGAMMNLYSIVNLDAGYEHTLIFSEFEFSRWIVGASTELIVQRTVDFFSYIILKNNPKWGAFSLFVVKNGISMLLYEFRKKQMFWPLDSQTPLSFRNVYIGLNIIF